MINCKEVCFDGLRPIITLNFMFIGLISVAKKNWKIKLTFSICWCRTRLYRLLCD